MLKRREVKTYKVELICDECGTPMQFTGKVRFRGTNSTNVGDVVLTTYPEQYVHRCPKCGRTSCPDCAYPITEYEYIDEDGE